METDTARESLLPLLRSALGSGVELAGFEVAKERRDYLVLLARLSHPTLDVVVKLAGPGAPLACPFDRTAALHRRVALETRVPVAEMLAVDVSYRQWPWRYAILKQVPGELWATARARMGAGARADAYVQIGETVAQLHSVRFAGFGEVDGAGEVAQPQSYLVALRRRAEAFIRSDRLRDLFYVALDRDAALFDGVTAASLCHEDLHKYNILFESRQGRWHLSGVLDFDKAWAGYGETDLARLELWTGMTHPEFWHAYEAVRSVDPGYVRRRAIYQLFWCLEFAQPTRRHLADTRRLCRELGLAPVTTFNG